MNQPDKLGPVETNAVSADTSEASTVKANTDEPSTETYTHGHHSSVTNQHARRTAEDCASFARHVIQSGSEILDVGCGPGSITVGLARWASSGRVIAVETSEKALELATQTIANAGVSNIELRAASVYELPFEDDSFDVAYAHQVMQHLSSPVAALAEMARVTRPDGYVAVRDADYSTMRGHPCGDIHDRWRKIYYQVARRNGGDPDAGRRLFSWCRAAGLTDVQMSAGVWQFWTTEERQNWGYSWAERSLESDLAHHAIEYGFATRSELEEISAGWKRWADAEDGYFHFIHGEALARPGASN